jgi:hypothetical protein
VTVSATGSSTNFVRAWITSAPSGSEWKAKLDEQSAGRVLFWEGQPARKFDHVFDRGGHYTIVAQEYVRGATTYGGGYQGDPASAPSETKVGAEATVNFYVGQRMTSPMGTGPDVATLVVWVWNDTIRQTRLEFQGEASPTIETQGTPTSRVQSAMAASAVTTALAALINVSTTTAVGSVQSIVSNFRIASGNHMASSVIHASADSVNPLPIVEGGSQGALLAEWVNMALSKLRGHYGNLNSAGQPSGGYHSAVDRSMLPLVQSVNGLAEAYPALADIWRSYEAHRSNTSIHASADGDALLALPPLLAVHREFFTVLASSNPPIPPGQTSGANRLIQQAGFSET